MAVTIDTTTASLATGYPHQRSEARCANGVRVAVLKADSTNAEIHYSTDEGATWTATGTTIASYDNGTCETDLDDNLWIAYKAPAGNVVLGRYTPNTARTAWTLYGTTTVEDSAYDRPSLVVFRDPAVSGGHVAVVGMQWNNGAQTGATARIVKHSAAGVPSLGPALVMMLPGSLATALNPSIDFHHTGDGKTVQGGTPHIYSVVASPDSGVVFRKHTYSAGVWTTGASVVLDSTVPTSGRLSAVFDGSRMCAFWSNGSTLEFAERDAADTTTTARTPTALADGTVLGVSITSDVAGDLWFAAIGDTSDDVSWSKLVRSTLTWGSWTATEAITATADTVQLRRAGTGLKVGVVYVQDTGTDAVRYHEIGTANTAPLAPTWVTTAGAADVSASLVLDWGFNDDQSVYGDAQSAYALKRTLSATDRWWNGTDWSATSETYITTSTTSLTLSSGWASASDAARDYYVRTKDTAGLAGPYSDAVNVVPSAKVNPTLTSSTSEATASRTTTWSVSEQSAYRARLLSGTTVLSDSDWRSSTSVATYTHTVTLSNSSTITEEITTRNAEGLASNAVTQSVSVAYTPPFQPGITISEDDPEGAITITITNPTPSGSRPEVLHNNLYRRVGSDESTAIKVAEVAVNGSFIDWQFSFGVGYEYYAEAVGANGTVSGAGEPDSGGGGGGTTGWTPGGGYALSFV